MADFVVISGVSPWDGRYQFDFDQEMSLREWGWIKTIAGYASPLDMGPHASTDQAMVAIYALCALHRTGKVDTPDIPALWERFQDAPMPSAITIELAPREQGDADPPPVSNDSKPSLNGDSSPTGSETSAATPAATGSPPSDTSVFDPAMSVT